MTKFDCLIIGGGPGGYVCAIRAAQNGLKVCLVEKDKIGGTCLNRGCMPTKSLLHSAELVEHAKEAEKYGVTVSGVQVDYTKVIDRRDQVVARLRGGVETLLKAHGVEVVNGSATLVDKNTVSVTTEKGQQQIQASNIILASGSVPAMPPIDGIENCVNSDHLLEGDMQLPERIVIVGGGVIGVEFATAFAAFGKQITIVEFADKLIPMFDRDVCLQLALNLKKQGVKINLSSKVGSVVKSENGLTVNFTDKAGEKSVEADMVVVCTGRRANTAGLGLDKLSIETQRGNIVVDKNNRTNVDTVYAIGDCTGGMMLAHTASAQGVAVAELLAGKHNHTSLSIIPSCIYTTPEIASVGMTAAECQAKEIEIEIGKFPMGANGKAIIVGQDKGFVKTIFEKSSGKLLGATLYCARATDLIGEFALAIGNNLTRDQYLAAMKPHPTVVEALFESAEASIGKAIHSK